MQSQPADQHRQQDESIAPPSGPATPSPWAAAVAILTLLAFGFVIGSIAGPSEEGPTVLLAAAPAQRSGAPLASVPASGHHAAAAQESEEEEPGEAGSENEEGEPEEAGFGSEEEAPQEAETKETGSEEESPQQEEPAKKEGKAKKRGQGASAGKGGAHSPASASAPPAIKHVFLIVLSDTGYAASFGAESKLPYLAKTLRGKGELIEDYYGVASGELANEIALISGQGPTPQTAADCPTYEDLTPGSAGREGQTLGAGCVYPHSTATIGDQLAAAGRTWKAYIQGIEGEGGTVGCRHPELASPPAPDPNAAPSAATPYVSWRDPFIYFHSTIDSPSTCAGHLGDMHTLAADLASAAKTPTLSYISPDPCDDGSPQPCSPGAPAGPADAEAFLKEVVPEIESSPAYRQGGLIAITSDQAPQSGPQADSSGCCITVQYPNLAAAAEAPTGSETVTTTTTATTSSAAGAAQGSGGGRLGLLLISQQVKPGSVETTGNYDHYCLLASIEQLFKLHPLGYAASPGLLTFGRGVYNAAAG